MCRVACSRTKGKQNFLIAQDLATCNSMTLSLRSTMSRFSSIIYKCRNSSNFLLYPNNILHATVDFKYIVLENPRRFSMRLWCSGITTRNLVFAPHALSCAPYPDVSLSLLFLLSSNPCASASTSKHAHTHNVYANDATHEVLSVRKYSITIQLFEKKMQTENCVKPDNIIKATNFK